MTTIVNIANIENFYHGRNFYWTSLREEYQNYKNYILCTVIFRYLHMNSYTMP